MESDSDASSVMKIAGLRRFWNGAVQSSVLNKNRKKQHHIPPMFISALCAIMRGNLQCIIMYVVSCHPVCVCLQNKRLYDIICGYIIEWHFCVLWVCVLSWFKAQLLISERSYLKGGRGGRVIFLFFLCNFPVMWLFHSEALKVSVLFFRLRTSESAH